MSKYYRIIPSVNWSIAQDTGWLRTSESIEKIQRGIYLNKDRDYNYRWCLWAHKFPACSELTQLEITIPENREHLIEPDLWSGNRCRKESENYKKNFCYPRPIPVSWAKKIERIEVVYRDMFGNSDTWDSEIISFDDYWALDSERRNDCSIRFRLENGVITDGYSR
jgi:hypothetical protein